jgi:hypothetical protein
MCSSLLKSYVTIIKKKQLFICTDYKIIIFKAYPTILKTIVLKFRYKD